MKMTEETEKLTPEQELNRIGYFRALNRRRFLAGLGTAGVAAEAAMVLGCTGSTHGNINAIPTVMGGTPQPNDVLNFALNLEYLEASFYHHRDRPLQHLASGTKTLGAAAQILAIEAYHASNIRQNIIQLGLPSMDKATDSMDVPTSTTDSASGTNDYFCEKGGLAIGRTPQQVLNLVYANPAAGIKSGGFYPNGMNGTIVST